MTDYESCDEDDEEMKGDNTKWVTFSEDGWLINEVKRSCWISCLKYTPLIVCSHQSAAPPAT